MVSYIRPRKVQAIKEKVGKLDFNKILSLYSLKETIMKVKETHKRQENSANYV